MQQVVRALVVNVERTNIQRKAREAVRAVQVAMEVDIIQRRDLAAVQNVQLTNTGTAAAVELVDLTHIQRPDLMG